MKKDTTPYLPSRFQYIIGDEVYLINYFHAITELSQVQIFINLNISLTRFTTLRQVNRQSVYGHKSNIHSVHKFIFPSLCAGKGDQLVFVKYASSRLRNYSCLGTVFRGREGKYIALNNKYSHVRRINTNNDNLKGYAFKYTSRIFKRVI